MDIAASPLIINDKFGAEFLREATKFGSTHEKIIIYPSIYTANKQVHVLVSYEMYSALMQAFSTKFKGAQK